MMRFPLMMTCCLGVLVVGARLPAADSPTAPVAQAMTIAAERFLASLSPEERAKVERPFEDASRVDWHNIPKPQRKGLQIRDMSPAQRASCHELVKAALSDTGYAKAVKIMALEANLKEGEKNLANGHLRDPERYFLSIFGKPTTTGTWGWSFEGHHFSLNFVIRDSAVIADSPSFWGANPATVKVFVEGGPEVGTRTLADEEQLAFDLVASLTEAQLKQALIADKAPAEYRASGQPKPPSRVKEGVAVKGLTTAQQATLSTLLKVYSSHLESPLAAQRIAEIESNGWSDVYFAWAGSTKPGVGHYYRIEGPTFILELINVQSDPQGNPANHIHSVWRDPRGDFGLTQN